MFTVRFACRPFEPATGTAAPTCVMPPPENVACVVVSKCVADPVTSSCTFVLPRRALLGATEETAAGPAVTFMAFGQRDPLPPAWCRRGEW